MKKILLHPCYFGPISQFVALAQSEEVIFENEDNYQKQTYRNRMYIYGANGKLLLNIPIKHTGTKGSHQKYREVKIENDFNWQKQHWKSLQTAYRTSPFFEFYEDELSGLYQKKETFLLDFNYKCLQLTLDLLQLDLEYRKTSKFETEVPSEENGRVLVNAKTDKNWNFEKYHQVFENKRGFLPNLCILDLLFNEGPNASAYLEEQNLQF